MRELSVWCSGFGLFLLLAAGTASGQVETGASRERALDYAAQRAAAQLWDGLIASSARDLRIAFLPLFNDGASGAPRLYPVVRAELTGRTGRHSFYVRDEAEWKQLVSEIEFGARRADIMDAATIQRFGSVSGVEALLYGEVREASGTPDGRGVVRLTLFLAEVQSGRQLWSGNVTGEYTPVMENRPPVAAFTFDPPAPKAGDVVSFRDASTDPDGSIAGRAWDLNGDGRFDEATAAAADWVFPEAGRYTVSLQVRDDRGAEATVRGIVVVGEPEHAPSALDNLLAKGLENLTMIIVVLGVLLGIVIIWRLGSRPR